MMIRSTKGVCQCHQIQSATAANNSARRTPRCRLGPASSPGWRLSLIGFGVNFYKHHIGDYDADTAHLSWLEDAAYSRLMRLYYRREAPIPADLGQACRLVRATSKQERDAVDLVLREFFALEADGWHNKRCDEEIAAAQAKAEKNRMVGKLGGRPEKKETMMVSKNNHDGFQKEPNDNPSQTPDSRLQTKSSASTAEPPPTPKPSQPSPAAERAPPGDFVQLAIELRKVGVACTASHPRVIEWGRQGVTVTMALEAVEVARMHKPGEAVSPNYLAPIIAEMLHPKPPPEPPWWNTPEATIAKGEALGIRAKPGEQMAEYRDRIREAAKGQRAAA